MRFKNNKEYYVRINKLKNLQKFPAKETKKQQQQQQQLQSNQN